MSVSEKPFDELDSARPKAAPKRWLLAVGLVAAALACAGAAMTGTSSPEQGKSEGPSSKGTPANESGRDSSGGSTKTAARFSVTIRKPAGPPRVATGQTDQHGKQITVACSSCHTNRPANHGNTTSQDLDEFHSGMNVAHGKVSCLSCHNGGDYDALKLADGSRVEFVDVMKLCAQCHGPQMKAYEHGAHGGMNGYWDLTRGPRVKNNCVDCHNPHAPQFPKMRPTFKPKDRFLEQPRTEH